MDRGKLLRTLLLPGVTLLWMSHSAEAQTSSPQPAFSPTVHSTSPQVSPSEQPAPTPPVTPSPAVSPGVPNNPPVPAHDTVVRLKVFLDQHSYGPGEIDNRWNDLCANALRLYQSATGTNATGRVDGELEEQLNRLVPLYTTYQIKSGDLQWVGKSPAKLARQAKLKSTPYSSIAEFVAERFHTSVAFLAELNRGKNLDRLAPGDAVQVPNVAPLEIESLKPADDIPPKLELNSHVINVDTKKKILEIREGDNLLAAFPITPGSKQLPAPVGTWKVTKMTTLPWFRWDKAMLLHGRRSGDYYRIPPGPRNEVGVVWIGLNKKGIGIHGTNTPETIGRSASHGCIRLTNWDAVRVLNFITQGATVRIY
jgi:lipoprotein-anchoring transpeptidase ErfK/SrfK